MTITGKQLCLFDDNEFDIGDRLFSLRSMIHLDMPPMFSVDSIQKMGKMYGVTCETVQRNHERVVDDLNKQYQMMESDDNE